MKKRILALICAAVMVFLLIPTSAGAVVSELTRENGWIVGVDDAAPGGKLIIGYTGSETTVTIPTIVGGWQISGVHQFAFQDNTTIKTINVPDGITVQSLGACQVETVNFSKNARVSAGAFANCAKLKNVVLPETMEELPANLFKGCGSLTAVNIPEGVTVIGEGAFSGCSSLTELVLPDSVVEIKSRAFLDCTNLKSVNIPGGVTQIWGEEPFAGCRVLSEIRVDPENTVYYNDAEGNLCTNANDNSTDYVVLVRSVAGNYGDSYTVPSHITYLARACFSGVAGLKKLVIPATVTYVDGPMVAHCPDLTEVWFEALPDRFVGYAFEDAVLDVYYPGDVGYWDNLIEGAKGELTWIPYCSGIHKGEAGAVIQEPTCTSVGYAKSVCELCGEDFDLELAMTEHPYDEGTVLKEPTCAEYGEMLYTCTVCGDSYTDSIDTLEHTYDKGVYTVEPGCNNSGELLQKCAVCGSESISRVDALGHDYSMLVADWSGEAWVHSNTCSRCGLIEYTESCTLTEAVIREATLDEHGLREVRCTVCGQSRRARYSYRISGDNRCATAYAVADQMKEILGVEKFDAILISSGDSFADALAGSFLAAEKNSPILLYREKYIADNADYIRNNLKSGGTVYILGGPAAVSREMEEALADFRVKRISGDTRFDTNLEILKEAGVAGGEILVATGWEFADSLSASAVGKPILLVNSITGELTENQKEFLSTLENASFTIIGGTAAVGEELAEALAAYGPVERICGNTREETSVKVAERYFENPDRILLAYSRNFPDGLCGGPLAYALGAPLILTNAGQEAPAAKYVERRAVTKGAILGGSAVLTDETVSRVFVLN